MKKVKLSYVLIGFAAVAQGVMWINVFALLHSGPLAYIGGIPAGIAIVGLVARSANVLPREQGKRSSRAGWTLLGLLVVIEPIVLGFANYTAMAVKSWIVAGGASLVITLALILGAIVDRSLVPVERAQSETKAKGKTAKRKKADFVCRYAGAGCSQKFKSQNAANAHARGCAYKPIAVDIR